MEFAKVTSKGQTTIPKEVRDQLGLQPGDILSYEMQDQAVVVRKVEHFNSAWHQAVAVAQASGAVPRQPDSGLPFQS
jgi:AbrB family looped-hinge helix DNA binding protein